MFGIIEIGGALEVSDPSARAALKTTPTDEKYFRQTAWRVLVF